MNDMIYEPITRVNVSRSALADKIRNANITPVLLSAQEVNVLRGLLGVSDAIFSCEDPDCTHYGKPMSKDFICSGSPKKLPCGCKSHEDSMGVCPFAFEESNDEPRD